MSGPSHQKEGSQIAHDIVTDTSVKLGKQLEDGSRADLQRIVTDPEVPDREWYDALRRLNDSYRTA